MIFALLHWFHLLNRWRLDRRSDRSTVRTVPTVPTAHSEPSAHRPLAGSGRGRARSGPVPYLRALRSDAGMTTAEYAVGTVAAVAFAVVLFKVVQSPAVHSALSAIVTGALNVHL